MNLNKNLELSSINFWQTPSDSLPNLFSLKSEDKVNMFFQVKTVILFLHYYKYNMLDHKSAW